MKDSETLTPASASFSETIAKILYPIFMLILMLLMIGTAVIAVSVAYYSWRGIAEPDWINATSPIVSALAGVYDPQKGDASRMLDTIYITVTALVMGVFLRRCSGRYGWWEIGIVLGLLSLAIIHLIAYALLPDSPKTGEQIGAGKEFVEQLKFLLVRNSNVALAVFAAAIGVQVNTDKSTPSGSTPTPAITGSETAPLNTEQGALEKENEAR